jgi:serine protease Do
MRNAKLMPVAQTSASTDGASTSGGDTQVAATTTPLANAAAPAASFTPPPAGMPDFAQIAAAQGPAVVNISVSGTVKTRAARAPQIDPDDPFYEFFRRFGVPGMPGGPNGGGEGGSREVRGQGSGFIVSADGVILTNAHVVQDAQEVVVKLTDRREYRAKVLGSDKSTDVAVLKIEAKNLPTVRLGATKDLRVGEWVLAIGSPFGFENSVSAGVIRAACPSCRRTSRSTPATPAARCSTRAARWSASTRRSTAPRAATRACPSRFPSRSPTRSASRSRRAARCSTPSSA